MCPRSRIEDVFARFLNLDDRERERYVLIIPSQNLPLRYGIYICIDIFSIFTLLLNILAFMLRSFFPFCSPLTCASASVVQGFAVWDLKTSHNCSINYYIRIYTCYLINIRVLYIVIIPIITFSSSFLLQWYSRQRGN